jgi:hypothetical protein
MAWAVIPYGEGEAAAELELGPEQFGAWAVRGWIGSPQAGENL